VLASKSLPDVAQAQYHAGRSATCATSRSRFDGPPNTGFGIDKLAPCKVNIQYIDAVLAALLAGLYAHKILHFTLGTSPGDAAAK
jgi:hypothetical protein